METIIDTLNQCPEYIGKGIMQLLILTLGGVIVAWITTAVFGRRSEINAVEGTLLKRKLDIYEELFAKLELLKSVVQIPNALYESAVDGLKEEGVALANIKPGQILGIFDSPENLTSSYLRLDEYIAMKRLYFDDAVMVESLRFINYFAVLRREMVIFDEYFIDKGIRPDTPELASVKRLFIVELGIMLEDDFVNRINKLELALKLSFKNLSFRHHSESNYSYDYFSSPEGPIMSELLKTALFLKKETVSKLAHKAVLLGEIAVRKDNHQNRKG